MNAWLPWRPDARQALHLRAMLRRAKHMSLIVFSLVGCAAVVTALALWLFPVWCGFLRRQTHFPCLGRGTSWSGLVAFRTTFPALRDWSSA